MKKQTAKKRPAGMIALITVALVVFGVPSLQAQNIKINTRPLTPQEIVDYSLPTGTQGASGYPVVGLGQPVYLELLVESGTVVTQVVWTLDSVVDSDNLPVSSAAEISDSPLPSEMPTYDVGDQNSFDVIDRAVLVPDVRGTYTVSVEAMTDSTTLEASLEVVGSVFLGQSYTACTLCHASKQEGYGMTHHAVALKDNINDPDGHFSSRCISCHSLGYDTTPGAVNGGFDDVAAAQTPPWTFPPTLGTNNWDEMPTALQMKSNVQCENCHGPAQEHLRSGGDTSKIAVSLSAGNCSQCHDKQTHHVKATEWKTTLHAQGYVFRASGSCAPCHSTKGYIDANDPGMNEFDEIVATEGTGNEGITCAACHDPHSAGSGVHQVRAIGSITLSNGEVVADGGNGLVCMACHHDRRNAEEYVLTNARGPHHGTQTDMLFGKNAIEYGQNMPSSKHWDVVEDSCAQCHMQEAPSNIPAYAKNKVGGHTFMLSYNDGTNAPVHLTETCASCHGEVEDFNFGGADYDLDGVVEGVQQEIADMLTELAMLLPPYGEATVDTGQISNSNPAQLGLRKGAYNYLFVTEDGSLGVHNPKYTAALLRSSIDDLKGGIDIDKDGLVDSWEIENFGDLTSQSGADDFDSDGLSNAQEQNLGTDATLVDTDGDGISDLAEVQAGSDPLDIDSVPTSDMVILPAAEIGYLPQGTGAVVRIQSIDTLGGEGWQDLGPAQTNTGSMVYELDSMRGATNRFYRAIEE